ncbi:hypothetical protein [Enterococcus rivorum]|nr:hypothetical protein [Enterococcus rivorum]MBP2098907.1 hypothetical protein [Enterococcus rivorum]
MEDETQGFVIMMVTSFFVGVILLAVAVFHPELLQLAHAFLQKRSVTY